MKARERARQRPRTDSGGGARGIEGPYKPAEIEVLHRFVAQPIRGTAVEACHRVRDYLQVHDLLLVASLVPVLERDLVGATRLQDEILILLRESEVGVVKPTAAERNHVAASRRIHGVLAVTAIEGDDVGTAAEAQHVVPRAAGVELIAGAAGQRVVAAASVKEAIACLLHQRIVAAAALKEVVPGAAGELIVARAAGEVVVANRAGEVVIASAADERKPSVDGEFAARPCTGFIDGIHLDGKRAGLCRAAESLRRRVESKPTR